MHPLNPTKRRWLEDLVAGSLLFIAYLALGGYLCIRRGYLPYDSLARLVNAWLVLHGTEVKLASIGFIWPPLPTVVIIPFTLASYLVESWLAPVIVSALFMALAAVIVGHIGSLVGIPEGWRRLLVALFAINPLIVIFGANGMSEAMLAAAFLAAAYWLVRFWKGDRHIDMVLSAGIFGLLPLIRYEFAPLVAWTGVIVLLQSWLRRSVFDEEGFRHFLEGRLLAYTSLAIYPIFLWSIFNWFIMGSPVYFLANDRSAVSLADIQLSSYSALITDTLSSFRLVFGTWFLAFPLGLFACAGLLWLAARQKSGLFFGFVMLLLVMPILQFILLSQRANVPLLRYFMMAIPIGSVGALSVVEWLGPWAGQDRWKRLLVYGGLIGLFLVSDLGTWHQMRTYPYQNIEGETWLALTTDEKIDNRNFDDAYRVGQVLASTISPGSRVLIDTYQFGFGILLGARDHSLFLDFTDPNYEEALKDPARYVDYVIVPNTEQRGALYAINQAHKKLHSQGASWAEFVDVLPPTNLQWKLYRVKR